MSDTVKSLVAVRKMDTMKARVRNLKNEMLSEVVFHQAFMREHMIITDGRAEEQNAQLCRIAIVLEALHAQTKGGE